MRLVHHQHGPLHRPQGGGVDTDELVTGQQHVELDVTALSHLGRLDPATHSLLVERQLVFADDHARIFVPDVGDDVEFGCPEFKLSLPVDDGGERGRHEERPFAVTLKKQKNQQVNLMVQLAGVLKTPRQLAKCKLKSGLASTYKNPFASLAVFFPPLTCLSFILDQLFSDLANEHAKILASLTSVLKERIHILEFDKCEIISYKDIHTLP
jgi:hypothetical protein